jgi:hypothetical protein
MKQMPRRHLRIKYATRPSDNNRFHVAANQLYVTRASLLWEQALYIIDAITRHCGLRAEARRNYVASFIHHDAECSLPGLSGFSSQSQATPEVFTLPTVMALLQAPRVRIAKSLLSGDRYDSCAFPVSHSH